jgi:uncharacterized protein YprB with RNaseH-like and TPR domain
MPESETYQQFRARGLCGSCASNPAVEGRAKCAQCLERDALYRADLRRDGIEPKASAKDLFLDPSLSRIGILDIESSGLRADFAVTFCVVIKIFGRDEIRTFKIDIRQRNMMEAEKRMLKELVHYMRGLDGVITYYGTGFDIPFLRTRMLAHGMVNYIRKVRHLDLYYTVRGKLLLSRNRLMNVIEMLQTSDGTVPDKGRVEPAKWMRCIFAGDELALNEIVAHCVEDVLALESALLKLQDVVPDRIIRK